MVANNLSRMEVAMLKQAVVMEAQIHPKFLGPTAAELARLTLAKWLDYVPVDTQEHPDGLARLLNQGSSQE